MPTNRTLAALYAFFNPGQSAGAITPDRIQDTIQTLRGAFACTTQIEDPVEVTTAVSNQWYPLGDDFTLASNSFGFTLNEEGNLVVPSATPMLVEVDVSLVAEGSDVGLLEFGLFADGVLIPGSERFLGLTPEANYSGPVFLRGCFSSKANDVIEVRVNERSSIGSFFLIKCQVIARGYPL